jgi:hypothetical protein
MNEEERKEYTKQWRNSNRIKVRGYDKKYHAKHSRLKRKYGVTPEEYIKLFNNQEGKCLIYGKHQIELKKALGVDHDHITGKVRGLLCNDCNLGIGHFKDNIEKLKLAIKYLEEKL